MPEGIWGAVFIALWLLLLAQSAMLIVLGRQMRRLYQDRGPDPALVGLALGAEVPEIEVTDIAGERLSLGGAAPWKRLLVFLSPGCPGCRTAIPEVQQLSANGAQTLLLWSLSPTKTRDLAEEYQIRLPMVADEDGQLWKQFMISGVPFAMVVDEQGRVAAKGFASRADQFEALLAPPETGDLVSIGASPPGPTPVVAK